MTRRRIAVPLAVVLLLVGCSGAPAGTSAATTPDELSTYTDRGDGCAQVVSAIGYADEALVPLGNEDYQTFDEGVRGQIATVSGAVALEVHDFPSARVLEQARRVAALADEASVNRASPGRIRALREFRREAAQLVLDCADAASTAPPTP